ncbi:MAG: hypothetical protein ABEK04_03675 [Candidatus Nanohalobium sp.]
MSGTTVRVGEGLREKLKTLRDEKGFSSYEELLEQLVENESRRVSLFGADKEMEEWSEHDRMEFDEE